MPREWESLNAKAEVARVHRHGHCHEAMMWYVHHLPESMKTPKMCESNGTSSPTLEESYPKKEGRRPEGPTRREGDDSDPGLATRRDRGLSCQKQGTTAKTTPPSRDAQKPWCGRTPSWAGPLTTSLRGLWVSGYLPRAMADRARGRRPENRP